MSDERLMLSEKYKAFLKCNAPVEFLEGTTAAGKTTVGLFKLCFKVAESPKKLHILAADVPERLRRISSRKTLGYWMILGCWLSTRAMVLANIRCRISCSTRQQEIR